MKRAVAAGVGIAVFVIVSWAMFQNMAPEWRRHRRLARSGVQIAGTVRAKEPMNHASIRYDYFVAGVRYAGGPCSVHTQFDRIRVGDTITVTYVPDSPSISTCEDPQAAYKTRFGMLFIIAPSFALFGALGMGFGLYFRYLRRPSTHSSNHAMQRTSGSTE
ncbi:MAG: hypothetical protein DMG40_27875 [Acidobacteria bacterium]|nr:MAG: hypothetical protein DMG40_27875 [Acidobacteriota bacterium]